MWDFHMKRSGCSSENLNETPKVGYEDIDDEDIQNQSSYESLGVAQVLCCLCLLLARASKPDWRVDS